MSGQMTALDPCPEVIVAAPWRLLATEAGRYASGLSTTVLMYEEQRLDRARLTHLGKPQDVEACVKSFAFSAGVSEDAMRQALLDLMGGIEDALRRQDEEARRARDDRTRPMASLDPAAGGVPIRDRFKVQADGVLYHEPPDPMGVTPSPFWVCSELRIVGATRDIHNDNHGHALEFRDRHGQLQRWAMPLELLEDRRDYRRVLRRRGLLMNGSKKGEDLLQLYLDLCHAQTKMVCVEKTGWHHGIYVLPDGAFGQRPDDEQVVLQGLEHPVDGYRQAGTLQAWQETIACLCVGNSRLLLAVSMGFAAVLLSPLGIEGGGIHLRGASSEGKTTVALVGASVWGEPGRVEHWRATANGLEGVAAAHNDNLLLLDELKEIDPREAGSVAYMLSNGAGKPRGRPEGGIGPRLTWTLLFLSTGEVSLAQHVEAAGHRVHAGQEVRFIDLPADAGQGRGVFEDLHGHDSGQVFADALRHHVQAAHGTAGRAFIAALVDDMPHALEQVRKVCDVFTEKCVPTAATGQVRRVAGRFALIGAAGELATAAGITGWEAGAALEAAATCFNNWLRQRGTLTNADETRALAQVRLFFERYGEARFHPWTADKMACPRCQGTGHHATGECFQCHGLGRLESKHTNGHVPDRAGFRRETSDGRTEFYVLPEVFRKEICKGYDPVWLGKVLVERGLLAPDSQGKVTCNVRLPGMGQTRVYCFTPEIAGTA
jgi:putative DNA primase/helicase